jgi:hypothetical protein
VLHRLKVNQRENLPRASKLKSVFCPPGTVLFSVPPVSTPSCSSSEGVKFGTDVTNIENQSTNVPDSMDDHTDAAVRSIIEASQNSFPEPQDPVSFPEPPNVLHIPESQNLEQKVDNIFVYDGTLDSYLKSSGGTNVNSNPVYINPGGVIVVPPETTPKQFYIVNNQQLVNMGVPAMNGVISDNDILAMPTIIVNEELDPNFVSQMRSTNSRPSEGAKKEKKIAPKLSNIHEFLTFNNPPQSTKRNIVKKTKKDKSLPFADRAVVAAPQATPSIVTAPSISEPIPPIITIPVSIANKTTPSIVTIATSVTASSVVTVSACSEASASTTSVVTVSASPRTTPSEVTVPASRTTPSVVTVPVSRTTPSVLTVPASRTTPSVTTASLTRQASHVRNLDFSTPSTKEEEHKPDEDDRAWDKDLRVLVQDCENKYPTPKRKRPVSSRTRKKSKCKGEEVKAEDAKEKEVETKAEKKKKVKTEKEKKEKKVKTEKEKKKTKVKNKEKKGKEVKVEEEGEKEVRIEDEEGKEVRIEDEEGKEVRIEEEEEQEVRTEEEAEKMMKTGEDKEKEALRTPVKDMLPKTPGGDITTSSSCHCTPFTDVLEEHLKGVDLTSMPTPQIPITPGFALTPGEMMGCNQRLTDYSTSSSYYQPSDSEQNKSLDQLIEEYRTLDNKSPTPADKSPKLKILSDVVIEEGKVPNSETKKSEKRNCREHLKRFNRNVIGKKNLSLVNCQETPWSSESDSENESELSVEQNNQTVVLKNDSSEQKTGSVKKVVDQEVDVVKKSEIKDNLEKELHSAKKSRSGKDNDSRKKTDGRTVVGNNESLKKSKREEEIGGVEKSEVEKDSSVNVDSEKERDATNAISSIISTVEIKNTLDEDAKNKKSLLARLEVVRQRTIKKIKEPVEKPPRRQSTYKKSPKVTKKKQTKKKEVKPEENTDEEAQKLVKGLAQRGIHLVPNKSPYKAKEVEKPPLPVESVESDCTFDRRTYEDFEVATHEEKAKRKSMKNYDCNLLNKSMSAQVYIEELEEEVTRIIKWTPFQPLADFRPKVVTSATKKSKKCQETDDDLIMDMVVSGSLNEKSPETRQGWRGSSYLRSQLMFMF